MQFNLHNIMKACLTLLLIAALCCNAVATEIVCLTAEDPNNYDAVNFLKSFKNDTLTKAGYRVTVIEGNQPKPTHFPGLVESVDKADLIVVFVRRATPPDEQLKSIKKHLENGKPIVGIRTANHAFSVLPQDKIPENCVAWPEFVPEILGCDNTGYETKGLPYSVELHPKASATHEILKGIDLSGLQGHTSMYKVLPLARDVQTLLIGTAQGIQQQQPVAWTRVLPGSKSKVFYTSLGDPKDVQQPSVRKLIANGIEWALKK
jgi:type 1 glutamine amidotransferase